MLRAHLLSRARSPSSFEIYALSKAISSGLSGKASEASAQRSESHSELINRFYLFAVTHSMGPFHELVCIYTNILLFYFSLASTRLVDVFLPNGRSTDIANHSIHIYTNVLIVCIYIRFPLRPSLSTCRVIWHK